MVAMPRFPGANEPCLVVKRPMNSGLYGEIGLGHYRCQPIVTQVDGALERVGIIGA